MKWKTHIIIRKLVVIVWICTVPHHIFCSLILIFFQNIYRKIACWKVSSFFNVKCKWFLCQQSLSLNVRLGCVVGINPTDHSSVLGLWGGALRGNLSKNPSSYLRRFRRKPRKTPKGIGRQARPGIEPGTSRLPV